MFRILTITLLTPRAAGFVMPAMSTRAVNPTMTVTWSPQDLTKDSPGLRPIPEDDYVRQYRKRPELWPVEFFLIAYRRRRKKKTGKLETQVLVRKSANGTSKWGVGTGVPATRWVLSTQSTPPLGYKFSEPRIRFDASNYPEWDGEETWSYDKIELREDAFNGPGVAAALVDTELEEYAGKICEGLRATLSERISAAKTSWEADTLAVVKSIVDGANSRAGLQGTLRMSGLFQPRDGAGGGDGSSAPRYVALGENAPDHATLARSMRLYTMFPQMPDPMPLPSTPAEELKREIATRDARMAESGRDPHADAHGRRYTHRSTSNVSNTIHGVYLTLDATDLPGLDEVPALDLFGTTEVGREWVSLEELKVLDAAGTSLGTDDTKPTFISGFIVRQLVEEGVIDLASEPKGGAM